MRVAAGLLALAGIGVAGYLTVVHYGDASLVCVRGGGCETVQRSSYSELAGIPVALLGLVAYTTILVLIVWDAPTGRLAAASIALVGLVFSAYLLVLQLFVIDAICIWCAANDILIAPALALVTGLRLRAR